MTRIIRRLATLTCSLICLVQIAAAAPTTYAFDYGASDIGFTYDFNGDVIQGAFPLFSGNLVVDFQNIRNSKVEVSIDASKGKGGFVFATSALRGPKVLATRKFPTIFFKSTSAQVSEGKATVNGNVTVRGVTKPMTLRVRFFQLKGNAPEARDELQMVITGRLNRHDFGASGYPDMVGDFLDIKINAKIVKQ